MLIIDNMKTQNYQIKVDSSFATQMIPKICGYTHMEYTRNVHSGKKLSRECLRMRQLLRRYCEYNDNTMEFSLKLEIAHFKSVRQRLVALCLLTKANNDLNALIERWYARKYHPMG